VQRFFSYVTSSPHLDPNHPTIQWVLWDISLEVKQLQHEADHSLPFTDTLKIGVTPSPDGPGSQAAVVQNLYLSNMTQIKKYNSNSGFQ
jgi:hypothetical protein